MPKLKRSWAICNRVIHNDRFVPGLYEVITSYAEGAPKRGTRGSLWLLKELYPYTLFTQSFSYAISFDTGERVFLKGVSRE